MADELKQIADLLKEINRKVDSLPTSIKLAANQVFANELSAITNNAGVLTSGEFRSGNGADPNHGFTGVRVAYPPMPYNGELWNLVGVSNDVIQFGMKASDGKLYAADGSTIIDADGITSIGGTIGGWKIEDGKLSSGTTNIVLDSANKKISLNSSTYGQAGIQIDYNGGAPRFYIGDGADKYFEFDGTNLNYNGGTLNNVASGSEFRTGNGNIPGGGFTGFRIAYPAMSYAGDSWLAAAVADDILQVGFNADGKAYFAGGNAIIDENGITGTDMLKWMVSQSATHGGETRTGRIGMVVPSGETTPAWEMSYTKDEDAPAELVENGGFELGALTNWTATTETNGAWTIDNIVKHAGSYSAKWTPTILGKGYVKALLHFDGGDGTNTMTDETGRTWTAHGNAQLDTAQKALGTAAILFDGTGDYINTPDSADFNLAANDWEIETRFRVTSLINRTIAAQCDSNIYTPSLSFAIYIDGDGAVHTLIAHGSNTKELVSPISTYTTNTWHTISFSRYGNTLYQRVDGTLTDSMDVTGITVNNSSNNLTIGRYGNYNGSYFIGWIDEFIFVKGGVIHESDYTPAVAAYGALTPSTGVLTSDRIAVTAATNYFISSHAKTTVADGTIKIEIKWYDDPSAGSLLRTDFIGEVVSAGGFQQYNQTIAAPVSSQSAEIVLTCYETNTADVNFDNITATMTSVNQRLQLRDDGLYLNGTKIA